MKPDASQVPDVAVLIEYRKIKRPFPPPAAGPRRRASAGRIGGRLQRLKVMSGWRWAAEETDPKALATLEVWRKGDG